MTLQASSWQQFTIKHFAINSWNVVSQLRNIHHASSETNSGAAIKALLRLQFLLYCSFLNTVIFIAWTRKENRFLISQLYGSFTFLGLLNLFSHKTWRIFHVFSYVGIIILTAKLKEQGENENEINGDDEQSCCWMLHVDDMGYEYDMSIVENDILIFQVPVSIPSLIQ